jgi:hypothetical protein
MKCVNSININPRRIIQHIIPLLLQIKPSTEMFRNHLVSLSTVLLSFFVILLSTSSTRVSAWDPRIHASIEDAKKWISSSESTEAKTPDAPCNVSPSLGYLRSRLKLLIIKDKPLNRWGKYVHRHKFREGEEVQVLAAQPLIYSFYVKNVLEPYRSRLPEADATSTTFCYLDEIIVDCKDPEHMKGTRHACTAGTRDVGVCLPNSDSTTEGKCVSCYNLTSVIENGTSIKNADTLGYLNDTCEPSRHGGPNRVLRKNMIMELRRQSGILGGSWSRATSLKERRPEIIALQVRG